MKPGTTWEFLPVVHSSGEDSQVKMNGPVLGAFHRMLCLALSGAKVNTTVVLCA